MTGPITIGIVSGAIGGVVSAAVIGAAIAVWKWLWAEVPTPPLTKFRFDNANQFQHSQRRVVLWWRMYLAMVRWGDAGKPPDIPDYQTTRR